MKMKNLLFVILASLGLTASTMAQNLPNYIPADGLVGWWPFNGNANDESGNGNDGTVNGATLTEDRFGNVDGSYLFSENTNISCPIESSDFGNDFTISMWCKFLGYTNGNEYPTILIGENYNFVLQFTNTVNPPVLQSFFGSTTPGQYDGLTRAVHSVGEWVHILILNNEGITTIKFNGNTFGVSEQASIFQSGTFGQTIRIGGGFQVPAENFNGTLDDIAIYNRALSQEEITALYTGEPVNPPTACYPLPSNLQNGLVGYWPFCGNANDESGNGNDGTVNGATLTEDRFGVANAAYDFDGMDDLISVTHDTSLAITGNLTMSVWKKSSGHLGNYETYINKRSGGDWNYNLAASFYYGPGGCPGEVDKYVTSRRNNNGAEYELRFADVSVAASDNLWTNITAVISNNLVSFYENGILLGNSCFGSEFTIPSVDVSAPLTIGSCDCGLNEFFNGTLDDIGIWNRALSADEVQELYALNACTFTIYDTVTVENVVTVYDTVLTTVTDTLIINTLITELAPPANTNTIKVFPNPAGSTLSIDYGNFALMNGYQLRIENSLGQQVFQTNINQQSDTLSLGTWGGNGLYFVHIVDPQGNTIDIRKIVLQ